MNQAEQNDIFIGKSQVYLANSDQMDKTIHNCKILKESIPPVFKYVTVIGGMSGLNYIQYLRPKNIIFYDINPFAVEYLTFILELISISRNHRDFISRIFCRDLKIFEDTFKTMLNYKNQQIYLDLPVDEILQKDTCNRLSQSSQKIFKEYIYLRLENVVNQVCNCRRLLPCWKIDKDVPVGAGEAYGVDQDGCYIPNTNTFFYGYGWLANEQSFKETKRILHKANIQSCVVDLFTLTSEQWLTPGRSHVIHVSNINDFFKEKWDLWCRITAINASQRGSDCFAITSHKGIYQLFCSPHCRAYEAIAPYIQGNVVEITHIKNWGFHEFNPQTIVVYDYIKNEVQADTIILHILLGNKIKEDDFYYVVKKAVIESKRLVIMEHDETSKDWIDDKIVYPKRSDTKIHIEEIITSLNKKIKHEINVSGIKDNKRSYILVIE